MLIGTKTSLVDPNLGDGIVLFDEATGNFLGDFTPRIPELAAPDDLTFGPDGNLYVSVGGSSDLNLFAPNYPQNSAILRFSLSGEYLGMFATSDLLRRPYGNAFGPDGNLYVASFRTNQILRFNGTNGAFIDVFASDINNGLGSINGLNGPNGLLFGPDGSLYVTTQGSANTTSGDLSFAYSSQVLRYTPEQVLGIIADRTPSVFIDQPAFLPDTFDFISLLGLELAPDQQSIYPTFRTSNWHIEYFNEAMGLTETLAR